MKKFIYLGENIYLNSIVIKDKKEYNDCIKIYTIYGEIYKIKKENKNETKI